jgi:cell shape-determining protein MreC
MRNVRLRAHAPAHAHQQLEDENERLRDEIEELKQRLSLMNPPKRTPYQKSKLCFDPRDEWFD